MRSYLFISYARTDYDTFVIRFKNDLQIYGLSVWIDQHDLKPGTPDWENTIRKAIKDATAVVLIATPMSRQSPYVRDELAIARMESVPIYPVWADGKDDRWIDCIPMGFGFVQAIDMRGAHYGTGLTRILETLAGQSIAPTLEPEGTGVSNAKQVRNPYKGLNAFTERDKDDFFGRETLTIELIERVNALRDTPPRFLSIIGASGAGKSSVVMAGLIPALKDNWIILNRMTPGKNPLRALRKTLQNRLDRGGLMDDLERKRGDGLLLLADEISVNDQMIVLFIDQFEEIFTQTENEDERQQFINLLTVAANDTDCPLLIVVTLRADFYQYPMNYPELGALFDTQSKSILPMSITELVDAVMKPADQANLKFESGLAAEIVFELREDQRALSGALPLLQFTLERLYENRDGETLTRSAYEQIGGVQGAIGTHAETVFATIVRRLGDTHAQQILEMVFLSLINVDERGTPTRKRTSLESVRQLNKQASLLVDLLISERLIIASRENDEVAYVEIAHEALLRSWDRLVAWIETIAEDLILRDKVIRATYEWGKAGKPEFLLWKHEQLIEVYEMRKRLNFKFDDTTEEFIRPESERLLAQFVSDRTEYRRLSIVDRWTEIGVSAIPFAVKAFLYKKSRQISYSLLNFFRLHPRESSLIFLAYLKQSTVQGVLEIRYREMMIDTLQQLGSLSDTTIDQLVEIVLYEEISLAVYTAKVLSNAVVDFPQSVNYMIALGSHLNSKQIETLKFLAKRLDTYPTQVVMKQTDKLLAEYKNFDHEVAPIFTLLLQYKDTAVRRRLIDTLGSKEIEFTLLTILIDKLKDTAEVSGEKIRVCDYAARSLLMHGHSKGFAHLKNATSNSTQDIAHFATNALLDVQLQSHVKLYSEIENWKNTWITSTNAGNT